MVLKKPIITVLLGLNQKIKKCSSTVEFKKSKPIPIKVSNLRPR